jgi:two-component system, OmpR family, KDP operon response regulator KdpE
MNEHTILIIDDEIQIRKLLQIVLENNAFKTIVAETGKMGILLAANHQPDLIMLDIGLHDMSGHDVLKELRNWYNKPILILSVLNSEEDIVKAIDNGADDYLVKPFRTGELLARIRSAIRRSTGSGQEYMINFGDLSIDFVNRTIKKKQAVIKLTAKEYDLLSLFVRNDGKVLTHQFLLKEIWGPTQLNETQYLRVFIGNLRKKIEENPNNPKHIITETGIGYRFT